MIYNRTPLDHPSPTEVATPEFWFLLGVVTLLGTLAVSMPEPVYELVVSSGTIEPAPCFG
jgi:hypothetical protein